MYTGEPPSEAPGRVLLPQSACCVQQGSWCWPKESRLSTRSRGALRLSCHRRHEQQGGSRARPCGGTYFCRRHSYLSLPHWLQSSKPCWKQSRRSNLPSEKRKQASGHSAPKCWLVCVIPGSDLEGLLVVCGLSYLLTRGMEPWKPVTTRGRHCPLWVWFWSVPTRPHLNGRDSSSVSGGSNGRATRLHLSSGVAKPKTQSRPTAVAECDGVSTD